MMYWKLAIQNIRRSLRDYIIYFVTLTLTAALMYSFLALGFSSDDYPPEYRSDPIPTIRLQQISSKAANQ